MVWYGNWPTTKLTVKWSDGHIWWSPLMMMDWTNLHSELNNLLGFDNQKCISKMLILNGLWTVNIIEISYWLMIIFIGFNWHATPWLTCYKDKLCQWNWNSIHKARHAITSELLGHGVKFGHNFVGPAACWLQVHTSRLALKVVCRCVIVIFLCLLLPHSSYHWLLITTEYFDRLKTINWYNSADLSWQKKLQLSILICLSDLYRPINLQLLIKIWSKCLKVLPL